MYYTRDTNPYRNLAREESLLLSMSESREEAIFFLWQNACTVVIGRNQNTWRECDTALLAEEQGLLARRTTGGGAVFHDMGNLNFSFVLPRKAYQLEKQLGVIQEALSSLGVSCAFSGRNDLIAEDGRKFSGNAFRFTKEAALHHGTLMVSVDPEKLSRYLHVSREKLAARGIQSVSSRVVNLSSLASIDIASLSEALHASFCNTYGACSFEEIKEDALDGFNALADRNASWDWNYGASPAFDISFSHRFSWGGVELLLKLTSGHIAECTVFTDAMDPRFSEEISSALTGCLFSREAMGNCTTGEMKAWLHALPI